MTVRERLKSRKFWVLIVGMVLTCVLILAGSVPPDTWKWFLGSAGLYYLGQGFADGAGK